MRPNHSAFIQLPPMSPQQAEQLVDCLGDLIRIVRACYQLHEPTARPMTESSSSRQTATVGPFDDDLPF